MQVKLELYAVRESDGGVIVRTVDLEDRQICMCVMHNNDNGDEIASVFNGPARELHAWAAKRNIPYQHVTLNVPVELEI